MRLPCEFDRVQHRAPICVQASMVPTQKERHFHHWLRICGSWRADRRKSAISLPQPRSTFEEALPDISCRRISVSGRIPQGSFFPSKEDRQENISHAVSLHHLASSSPREPGTTVDSISPHPHHVNRNRRIRNRAVSESAEIPPSGIGIIRKRTDPQRKTQGSRKLYRCS